MKISNAFPELELQDNVGNVYPLVMPTRGVSEWSGLGLPPIKHWTTRAPYQVGQSHWGYAIQPRVINLVLHSKGCDRAGMYEKTRANAAMLNPMNGPHVLRLITPDLRKYELHNVWVTGGYELSTQDQRTPRRQSSALQLTAYDPIWKWTNSSLDAGETRDAYGRTCVAMGALASEAELTLGFTGPFLLGTTVYTATFTATNDGSWLVKPVITVTGPLEDWSLTNATASKTMYWDGYNISAGETVTVDIPNKSITNGAGTSLTTYLSGDFGTFGLNPGANVINFWGAGGAGAGTAISFCWFVEVLGV